MSHTTTIETKFTDQAVLLEACRKLGIEASVGTAKLFDRSEFTGVVIKMPGWRFPAIVLADGSVKMDTYNDRWGKASDLNAIKQEYATEIVRRELRRKGMRFREVRENGVVKLLATVGA